MDIQVDPNLVNQGYRKLLAETQSHLQEQVVLYQAALTQLQDENGRLKEENERLLAASGRQDGVPQKDHASSEQDE
jgi:HPt (histidine-containing phosphotransfer) domain-containing protein